MAIKKLILKNVDMDKIKPYKNNPYDHRDNIKHIENSIKDFGYIKISR